MEEMQSIVKRIETDRDDLDAWQRLGELVDDPQKKSDCREQVARIKKEYGADPMPVAAPADAGASRLNTSRTATLLGGQLMLILIIASNLLPVFGIIFLGWSMGSMMILYWVENVMVGFFTILKMVFADEQAGSWLARIPIIIFFCIHFGGFCAGHLVFIIALFMPRTLQVWNMQTTPWNLLNLLAELWLPILGMFISYSVYFYQHYLGDGIYQRVSVNNLMAEPYPRIMILHVGLILGGFLVMGLGSPIGVILLLVALKTGGEVINYRKSLVKWLTSVRRFQALLH